MVLHATGQLAFETCTHILEFGHEAKQTDMQTCMQTYRASQYSYACVVVCVTAQKSAPCAVMLAGQAYQTLTAVIQLQQGTVTCIEQTLTLLEASRFLICFAC